MAKRGAGKRTEDARSNVAPKVVRTKLHEATSMDHTPQPVELRPWTNVNSMAGSFPVFCDLYFGPIRVEGPGRDYTIHIRSAKLGLRVDGFEPDPTVKRHKRVLKRDQVKSQLKMHVDEHEKTGLSGKLTARFGLKWLRGEAGATKSVGKNVTASWDIDATAEFVLEERLQNLEWRIGDAELGDIGKRQRFLDGQYLVDENDAVVTLCQLQPIPGATEKAIVATVTVAQSDMKVVADGGHAGDDAIGGGDEGVFTAAFKDKLRSIKLMDGMGWRNEFVLARRSMPIREAIEDEDDR